MVLEYSHDPTWCERKLDCITRPARGKKVAFLPAAAASLMLALSCLSNLVLLVLPWVKAENVIWNGAIVSDFVYSVRGLCRRPGGSGGACYTWASGSVDMEGACCDTREAWEWCGVLLATSMLINGVAAAVNTLGLFQCRSRNSVHVFSGFMALTAGFLTAIAILRVIASPSVDPDNFTYVRTNRNTSMIWLPGFFLVLACLGADVTCFLILSLFSCMPCGFYAKKDAPIPDSKCTQWCMCLLKRLPQDWLTLPDPEPDEDGNVQAATRPAWLTAHAAARTAMLQAKAAKKYRLKSPEAKVVPEEALLGGDSIRGEAKTADGDGDGVKEAGDGDKEDETSTDKEGRIVAVGDTEAKV